MNAALPNSLDEGPEIHPAKLASYCDAQGIKLYTYKHTNLECAEKPFTPGDYVIKPDYDDSDLAVVVDVDEDGNRDVSIEFCHQLKEESDGETYVATEFRVTAEGHDEEVVTLDDASNVIVTEATFEPRGSSEWHQHPGLGIVNVAKGEIEIVHGDDCTTATYTAGEAFIYPPSTSIPQRTPVTPRARVST